MSRWSVAKRHGKSKANRPFVVDGREYLVSISHAGFDDKKNVIMRVTFRAQFGMRSVCLVRGLTNRSLYADYPDDPRKWRAEVVSITPKVLCEMIRYAHQNGWEPQKSKANFELVMDRKVVRGICESVRVE